MVVSSPAPGGRWRLRASSHTGARLLVLSVALAGTVSVSVGKGPWKHLAPPRAESCGPQKEKGHCDSTEPR